MFSVFLIAFLFFALHFLQLDLKVEKKNTSTPFSECLKMFAILQLRIR